MASRIEDIFPQLQSLWKSNWKKVEAERARTISRSAESETGKDLIAIIDLQLIKAHSRDLETSAAPLYLSALSRTTDTQMLKALIILFSSILNYVRITDDNGDAILTMLSPVMNEPSNEKVRQALETWNADAFWLIFERRQIEHQMMEGIRDSNDWEWRPTSEPSDVDSSTFSSIRKVLF